MHTTAQLISEALHLKPAEPFMIIEALTQSLDAPNNELEEVWIKEAEKRLAAYKAGGLKVISFTDIFGSSEP